MGSQLLDLDLDLGLDFDGDFDERRVFRDEDGRAAGSSSSTISSSSCASFGAGSTGFASPSSPTSGAGASSVTLGTGSAASADAGADGGTGSAGGAGAAGGGAGDGAGSGEDATGAGSGAAGAASFEPVPPNSGTATAVATIAAHARDETDRRRLARIGDDRVAVGRRFAAAVARLIVRLSSGQGREVLELPPAPEAGGHEHVEAGLVVDLFLVDERRDLLLEQLAHEGAELGHRDDETAAPGERFEVVLQLLRRRVPLVGVARERLHHDRLEVVRIQNVDGLGARSVPFGDPAQHRELRFGLEEPLADRELPQQHADREDVAAAVHGAGLALLGRHVRDLALERPRGGQHLGGGRLGDAEVHHLHAAVERDEHVRRRDVAVHDVEWMAAFVVLLVGVMQPGTDTDADVERVVEAQALLALLGPSHHAGQIATADKLHREVVRAVALADVVDLNHVGVVESRREAGLVKEHLHELGIVGVLGQDPFQRHELREALDRFGTREEQLRHAAHAQPTQQSMVADVPTPACLSGFGDGVCPRSVQINPAQGWALGRCRSTAPRPRRGFRDASVRIIGFAFGSPSKVARVAARTRPQEHTRSSSRRTTIAIEFLARVGRSATIRASMGLERRWQWMLLAGVASFAPACALPGFSCERPEECVSDGIQGVCQPSGFCSFPDEDCESAQRYGDHAGEFSDECVGPDVTSGSESESSSSSSSTVGESTGPDPSAWTYARVVSITTTSATTLSDHQVVVDLAAADFDYARALEDGADVRFVTSLEPDADPLSHYAERWNEAGESRLWVRVPELAAAETLDVYMLYGNPDATSASSLDDTFPSAFVSEGTHTLGGAQSFGWFHLRSGDEVEIEAGAALTIDARNVIIEGSLVGVGAGHPGGDSDGSGGEGPGGGEGSSDAGAGGGGHGGAGGAGGYDTDDTQAQGGSAHGDEDSMEIEMGSGGGGTDLRLGGAGGGAVTIIARTIAVAGEIRVDGATGGGMGEEMERGGGGGGGGGIMLAAFELALDGLLSARGGDGGNRETEEMANDGGGGGGGGRVKIFHGPTAVDTQSVDVDGGPGGLFGGEEVGEDGAAGTVHAEAGTTDVSTATLGPEMEL